MQVEYHSGLASFDLASYASRYSGPSKLQRLKRIAEVSPDLRETAYKLIVEELKNNSYDTQMYQNVCAMAQSAGLKDPIFIPDNNWMESAESHSKARSIEINQTLHVAKTSIHKEDMRRAYMERAKFLQKQGDLIEAGKVFARCRDFVSSAAQSAEVSLAIAIIGLDIGNYQLAYQWIGRIDMNLSNSYKNKCRAILGIILLNEGNFKGAARQFTDIDSSIIGTFREVITGEDVATYGALCAVTTSDYNEVQCLLRSRRFKAMLELVPDLRLILDNYSPSNAGAFLGWAYTKKAELLLDIHLKANVEKLFASLTDRLLLQYFKPYRSVTIQSMSEKMCIPMDKLEANLASLIASKKLAARIDSESHTLHANVLNEREHAFKRVHDVAKTHTASVKQSILRLSLVKNHFIVMGEKAETGGSGMDVELDD